MHRRFMIVLLAALVVFAGCAPGGAKSFEKASKRLAGLDSYACDVTMRITNNKSTMEYKLRHYYKRPDKYKIEVLEPKELEGQTTVYNGRKAFIYHPKINQVLAMENFNGSMEQQAFVGSFLHYLGSPEQIKVRRQSIKSGDCFVLEFELPDKNRYRRLQKIWLDAAEGVPVKAEIYDENGKAAVELIYSNFERNPGLQDSDFEAADISNAL